MTHAFLRQVLILNSDILILNILLPSVLWVRIKPTVIRDCHEAISREFRVALPWELLYADELAVIAKTEEELINRLNE